MFRFPKRKNSVVSEEVIDALGFSYNEAEIAAMDRLGTRTEVPADTVIAAEGEFGSQAVVILDGAAGVYRDGAEVATVGPADVVGEGSLLTGKPRNASVVAKTPVDLVIFTTREFASLLDTCPRLKVQMKQLVDERVPV